jgi:raffinose/stachyose/melibiose transport system substrate-binding protein
MATPASSRWINLLGLGVLVFCYLGALVNVFRIQRDELTHDTIRIVHWQLESGVRDGVTEMIRRFEAHMVKTGRRVRVVQILIPEGAYKQYVTTQTIGRTAPDLVELGRFPGEFYGRYFLPLSDVLKEPNPLVADRIVEFEKEAATNATAAAWIEPYSKLRDLPWIESFTDGLRTQFREEAQEYFGVGFSQFTVRIFYNKKIFRAALGSTEPPAAFEELLEVSRRIRAYAEESGQDIVPIASADYQTGIFKDRFLTALTADLALRFDVDLDGNCSEDETVAALLTGEWTPEDEQYRSALAMLRELSSFFPRGFMSFGRMDSAFSFIQGKAAMITSGSWDAKSYLSNIENQSPEQRFDVGIFDFPLIGPDDPKYGAYADGRATEANTGTGFAFGMTRFSRHQDLCIEFLQFCTLPENNTVLNAHAQWIPSVRGARTTPMLSAFEPDFSGYWQRMHFGTGERGTMVERQVFWPFISGEIDYEEYASRLMKELPDSAAVDFARRYRAARESVPELNGRRSAYLAAQALAKSEEARSGYRIKLLRTWDQLMGYETKQARTDALLDHTKRQIEAIGDISAFNRKFQPQLKRELGL